VTERAVVFAPAALEDLRSIGAYVSVMAGPERAFAYVNRIEAYCRGFAIHPHRGTRRDDVRPGLRTVGFERRVTIAFPIDPDRVTIDRNLHVGRDLVRGLRES
jgi:toxin ParE1/3/4